MKTANDAELIHRWIELDPNRPGRSEARVKDHGVAVWALVGHWQATGRCAEETARSYDLPLEAVKAALASYWQNLALIEARLEANVS